MAPLPVHGLNADPFLNCLHLRACVYRAFNLRPVSEIGLGASHEGGGGACAAQAAQAARAARTSKKRVRRPPTIRQPRDFQRNGLPVFKLKNSEDSKIMKPKPEM